MFSIEDEDKKLKTLAFEDLKGIYEKSHCRGTSRKSYSPRKHRINDLSCFNFSCEKCRKQLVPFLFENTITAVSIFGLDKHLILTSEGSRYRDNNSYEKSYVDMAQSWNKLKKVIEYRYGKLDYISFPRAQKDGFCHYHILTNKYIPKSFLEDKKKRYSNMGYLKIKRHISVAEYLTGDFFKDTEYIIPFGKKHFTCSKKISPYMDISKFLVGNPENLIFQLVNNGVPICEQYYSIISQGFGYPPPLENLLFEFVKEYRKNERNEKRKTKISRLVNSELPT